MCFCLKIHYLVYIFDWHWTCSQPHYNSFLSKVYLTHVFSPRHITALELPGTLESKHFSTMLRGHFKCENHQQKTHKCSKVSPNSSKRTLVYSMRVETRSQSIAWISSAETVSVGQLKLFATLCMYVLQGRLQCPQMTAIHKYWHCGYKQVLASR